MRARALVALLAGCSAVPADSTAEPAPVVDGQRATESSPPTNAAAATSVILSAYAQLVGIDARDAVSVDVHWATRMPPGLLGATWHSYEHGCDSWIIADAMFSHPRVLPHELGHCVRWVMTGDGDPAHADATWWSDGGTVDRAFTAERAAGF